MTNIFIATVWLDQLLKHVIAQKGSDVHIEPSESGYQVRVRYDGLLQAYAQLNSEQGLALISRLKVLSHCDIAEKRLPQDGRINYELFHDWDFRLSTCPTVFGEKIVIRNLNAMQSTMQLSELGMTQQQFISCQKILTKPQGLILVTGPTGSGKSVTLYSALKSLHDSHINIVTVEDPVEMYLSGINQINVNPKAGLSFVMILKAILRQDPDIIMVGEMRDYETAELALAAAQTGHLVLSTLHTNTTIDSLTRLLQMGFEPYQIQSALQMVIAQRLVRRLCLTCKEKASTSGLYHQQSIEHYVAQGCEACHDGYRGRTAIYEILILDDELKNIMQHHDAKALKAYRQNIFTIHDHALEKIQSGETSIAEVVRVLG